MYAVDVYEYSRKKYEERIIAVAEKNNVVDTEFDVEYDEEKGKDLYFYRAWCE